jgi:hypothetical protein
MDPSKVESITTWPVPRKASEISSFLGFTNFYRKFIANYAELAQPLTRLLCKDTIFEWTQKEASAFAAIKEAFLRSDILAHPNNTKAWIVETDASDFALGAVLSQYNSDNNLVPVAFHSRQLVPAERNYDVYDKELLGIIDSLKEWRHFLLGTEIPVTVICDHKNLEYFTSQRQLTRRQARWSLFLTEFNVNFTYRSGALNGKADKLSRRVDYIPEQSDAETHNFKTLIQPLQIIAASSSSVRSEQSVFITKVLSATASLPNKSSFIKKEGLREFRGLLWQGDRLYIPTEELKLDILQSRHDNQGAGHFGITKTFDLIHRDFWWPNLIEYVSKYVKACQCQRFKTPRHKPQGLLQPLSIPTRPWSSVSTDLIVELPPSNGYNAVSVWVCRLTKMAHFIPCNTTISSSQLATVFLSNIFRAHGLPKDIVSDRGSQFTSRFWSALCQALEIKAKRSTAFHPQTDGQTERVNQTLEQYLRVFMNFHQDNWSDLLPIAEFAYNNSINASTKMSPFYANYGFHPSGDTLSNIADNLNLPSLESRTLKEITKELTENLVRAQATYKRFADKKRLDRSFAKGEFVYLSAKNLRTDRPNKKFDVRLLGPFRILEKVGTLAYRLELPPASRAHPVFHVSLLHPATVNEFSKPEENFEIRPVPVTQEGEYEVASILDSRLRRSRLQYLVEWAGLPRSEATWEDSINLQNCSESVESFHLHFPNKPASSQPLVKEQHRSLPRKKILTAFMSSTLSAHSSTAPKFRINDTVLIKGSSLFPPRLFPLGPYVVEKLLSHGYVQLAIPSALHVYIPVTQHCSALELYDHLAPTLLVRHSSPLMESSTTDEVSLSIVQADPETLRQLRHQSVSSPTLEFKHSRIPPVSLSEPVILSSQHPATAHTVTLPAIPQPLVPTSVISPQSLRVTAASPDPVSALAPSTATRYASTSARMPPAVPTRLTAKRSTVPPLLTMANYRRPVYSPNRIGTKLANWGSKMSILYSLALLHPFNSAEVVPPGQDTVKSIVDSRYQERKKHGEYLVEWTGHDEITWEPAQSVNFLYSHLYRFHRDFLDAPGPFLPRGAAEYSSYGTSTNAPMFVPSPTNLQTPGDITGFPALLPAVVRPAVTDTDAPAATSTPMPTAPAVGPASFESISTSSGNWVPTAASCPDPPSTPATSHASDLTVTLTPSARPLSTALEWFPSSTPGRFRKRPGTVSEGEEE